MLEMKPRFSILTLLGITGYVATVAAGIVEPLSHWSSVAIYAWMAILFWSAIEAMCSKSLRSAFAGGFFAANLIYAVSADNVLDHRHPNRINLHASQLLGDIAMGIAADFRNTADI
jgi:hypothetical protein